MSLRFSLFCFTAPSILFRWKQKNEKTIFFSCATIPWFSLIFCLVSFFLFPHFLSGFLQSNRDPQSFPFSFFLRKFNSFEASLVKKRNKLNLIYSHAERSLPLIRRKRWFYLYQGLNSDILWLSVEFVFWYAFLSEHIALIGGEKQKRESIAES